jgi:hypothetical protein
VSRASRSRSRCSSEGASLASTRRNRSAASSPPPGKGSTWTTTSPATRRGAREVTSQEVRGLRARRRSTNGPPPSTCSRLSRTTTSGATSASERAACSSTSTSELGASRVPSAWSTRWAAVPPSRAALRSKNHAPAPRAWQAVRVLPTPPGPARVTTTPGAAAPANAVSSSRRPTNDVRQRGGAALRGTGPTAATGPRTRTCRPPWRSCRRRPRPRPSARTTRRRARRPRPGSGHRRRGGTTRLVHAGPWPSHWNVTVAAASWDSVSPSSVNRARSVISAVASRPVASSSRRKPQVPDCTRSTAWPSGQGAKSSRPPSPRAREGVPPPSQGAAAGVSSPAQAVRASAAAASRACPVRRPPAACPRRGGTNASRPAPWW